MEDCQMSVVEWNRLMDQIRMLGPADLRNLNKAVVAQIKEQRSVAAAGAVHDLRDHIGEAITVHDPRHGTRDAKLMEARRTRCVVVFASDPLRKRWSVPANWIRVVTATTKAAG